MAKKEKAPKQKKPIFKRWWFWLLAIIVIAGITGATTGGSNTATTPGEANTAPTTNAATAVDDAPMVNDSATEAPTAVPTEVADVSVDAIKEWADLGVGEDDDITNVAIGNGTLNISVALGDPTPLTLEDQADSRASSITDELLEHQELDQQWNKIVITFEGLGYFEFTKDDIQRNEYGMRYLDVYDTDGKSKMQKVE